MKQRLKKLLCIILAAVTVIAGNVYGTTEIHAADCNLSWGNIAEIDCYPKVTEGPAPSKSTKVIATIDGKEYTGLVHNGRFKITYPRHEAGKEIFFKAYDEHGCSTEQIKKKVYNYVWFNIEHEISHVYDGSVTGFSPSDYKLYAEINGKTYCGDYLDTNGVCILMSYPVQPAGTKIKFWFENENGWYSPTVIKTVEKKNISASIKDLSVNRASGYFNTSFNDYAEPSYVRATVNGKTYNGTFKEDDFGIFSYKISFPQQKIGSKVTVTVMDVDGCKAYASSTIKNRAFKFKINSGLDYADGEVWGETLPKTKITLKLGNRTYNTTADNDGDFSVDIPIFRTGTKVYIKAVAPSGYYKVINTSIKKSYCKVKIKNTQFTKTKYANIQCTGGEKTDKLKIKVSGKTITKKIKGKKFNETIKVKLPKKKAGKSIKVIIYDKYGDQRASTIKRIYIGRTIKVGMSAKKAVLTTWGKPVYKRKAKKGYKEWGFIRGNYGLIALIKKGKVAKVYKGRLD